MAREFGKGHFGNRGGLVSRAGRDGRLDQGVAGMIWRALTSWTVVIALSLVAVAATAPLSRLAINPISVDVDGDWVAVHRHFPADTFGLPRPRISYIETVKGFSPGTNAGHTCKERAGPFRYSQAKDVGQWAIEWAQPCLDDPVGYVWEACWTWHLGMFRFGAVCANKTQLRGNG